MGMPISCGAEGAGRGILAQTVIGAARRTEHQRGSELLPRNAWCVEPARGATWASWSRARAPVLKMLPGPIMPMSITARHFLVHVPNEIVHLPFGSGDAPLATGRFVHAVRGQATLWWRAKRRQQLRHLRQTLRLRLRYVCRNTSMRDYIVARILRVNAALNAVQSTPA